MGLFNRQTDPADAPKRKAKAGPVTREEHEALMRKLEAVLRIVALITVQAEEASRFNNMSGGPASTRRRLEKIAGKAREHFDLDATDLSVLRELNRACEELAHGEFLRSQAEEVARSRPRTAEDYQPGGRCAPMSWRG